MNDQRVFKMPFASVYPHYVRKAEKKGRTKKEVDDVICWLTGYTPKTLALQIKQTKDLETFFREAPSIHPNASQITGVICGVRIEEIPDPLMRKIRYMDKLVDELAQGRPMERILRAGTTAKPAESDMRAALGAAYDGFQALVADAGPGASEWRQYKKDSPWVLKVSERKRSLFYAQPEAGHVKVTVLLGPRAVTAALAGGVSKVLHASIRGAKAYPEGRPVVVLVRRPSDLAKVRQLITVKRDTRHAIRSARD